MLVLMVRAFVFGMSRVRRLARFGHRGAAARATAMLAAAFMPFMGGFLLVAVAIPNLMKLRTQANEMAAISALRVISEAEQQYNVTYPEHDFACQLSQLGGDSTASSPSADAAQFISSDLAAGTKAGYRFNLTCTQTIVSGRTMPTSFVATAVPDGEAKSGHRGFCIDDSGTIGVDPNGGTNSTDRLQ